MQLGVVRMGGEPVADLPGTVGGTPVDEEVNLVPQAVGEPTQEAAHHLGGEALG